MKKYISTIFACLLPLSIYAQDIPASNDGTDKVDSLTQVVNELSSKVQKVEDDARNVAIWNKRKKYFQIGYINQTLTHQDVPGLEWKSDFGVSLAMKQTFYLHKKPLFNMLKFGLDATWFDVSYAKYSQPKGWEGPSDPSDFEEGEAYFDLVAHQAETGLGIGPSITVNPIDHLKVSGYFHFIPSGSILVLNDEVNASYVSNFAYGGAISYKAISFGVESRWGKAKYNSFSVDEDAIDNSDREDFNPDDVLITGENRMKTKSVRFYLTLRF